jgi:hypothetical protein
MYSPINPEAYLRIQAAETRRTVERARIAAIRRQRRALNHHRDH